MAVRRRIGDRRRRAENRELMRNLRNPARIDEPPLEQIPNELMEVDIEQHDSLSQPIVENSRYNRLVNYDAAWIEAAKAFDDRVSELITFDCTSCLRSSPTLVLNNGSCQHCRKKNGEGIFKFSPLNNMDPGDIPLELAGLSRVSQMLIALIHPVVSLYRFKGNQYKYHGNCISFRQQIETYTRVLPHNLNDLSSVIVFSKPIKDGVAEFKVNREQIHAALLWLKRNNPYYEHIEISSVNLNLLPENGDISEHLMTLGADDSIDESNVANENIDNYNAIPNDNSIYESFVLENDPINNEEQIRRRLHLPYPARVTTPINEFTEEGFLTKAFPCLFPYGKADLNQAREVKLSILEYFQFLMEYRDRRYVLDPRFRFFALNMVMRHQTLSRVGIYLQKSDSAPIDIQQLRDQLRDNPSFINRLMAYSSSIRGGKPFWYQRSCELLDFCEQFHIPTAFITLSAADYHWPDLFKFIDPTCNLATITESERKRLMHDNPDHVAYFFKARCEIFLQLILKPLFKMVDFWYRYEWQHRGSTHLHGLFWLEDALDLSQLDQIIDNQEAIDLIVEYFDRLCVAINPDSTIPMVEICPPRKRFSDIGDSLEDRMKDLTELINVIQRHQTCDSRCWRYHKNDPTKKFCRFKFPIPIRDKASFERNDKGAWEFHPERNDERVNRYNAFIGQVWRANHDFSIVSDKHALLTYIAKYASKAEHSSSSYVQILRDMSRDELEETPARKLLSKFMISTFSERDFPSQEVCHLLMGWNLYSSSREFITLNLSDQWQPIDVDRNDHSVRESKTFLDRFCLRPVELQELSLLEYAKRYYYRGILYHKRHKDAVVRVFPRFKLNDDDENNQKYYRQKVILNVPFAGENFNFDDLLIDPDTGNRFPTWKARFESLGIANELNLEIPAIDPEEEGEIAFPDLLNDNDNRHIEPFAVQAAAINYQPEIPVSQNLGRRENDLAQVWTRESQPFPAISEVKAFLRTYRTEGHVEDEDESPLDPNIVFSAEQSQVLDINKEQLEFLQTRNGNPPRLVVVQGKAGTGKSTLIKAIKSQVKEALGDKALQVGAFTGVAARNVQGKTLHSIFHLPVGSGYKALSARQLQSMQNELREAQFIIIDEMSMVSPRLLKQIDLRCREAKSKPNESFGGMMVYLLGDFRQLPPVKVPSFYMSHRFSEMDAQGMTLFNSFEKFIELTVCYRQGGDDSARFRTLLDNIGNVPEGGIPQDDYELLMTRREAMVVCHCKWNGLGDPKCPRCSETKSFENAVRILAVNADVDEANNNFLRATGKPVARIVSVNTPDTGAALKGCSLKHVLNLAIGCRVMLRRNLAVEYGLVNGSLGTVEALVYEGGKVPPDLPEYVLVRFDDYKGPCLPSTDGLFPIIPVSDSWKNSSESYTRRQLPLSLAHAITIHKSQGLTLPKAVVALGESEMEVGLTYVQLSRVSKLTDLLIMGYFHKNRLDAIGKKREAKDLKVFLNKYWPKNE